MTSTISMPGVQAGRKTSEWRLLESYGLSGAMNMAVDEALLQSVIEGGLPVVRFYSWQPATLSLGTNQPVEEINSDEVSSRGFDLVRRITGGRGVLHQHELTYSVIASDSDPRVSGGVVESYRKISAALVDGLSKLGAQVSLAPPDRIMLRAAARARREHRLDEATGAAHGAICFDAASAYELTAGERKLIGSAQARRGGALLQHGSILLDIDFDAWSSVFAYATEAGRERARMKLPERMTSLREELGRIVCPEELAAVLARSYEKTLEIGLVASELSDDEQRLASRLAVEKYGSAAWTEQGTRKI